MEAVVVLLFLFLVLGHRFPVGEELEDDIGDVCGGDQDRTSAGHFRRRCCVSQRGHRLVLIRNRRQTGEDGHQAEAEARDEQQRGAHHRTKSTEFLLFPTAFDVSPACRRVLLRPHEAAHQERHAENQQHIRKDRAQQRRLDHREFIISQQCDRHDHLHRIAEGRVEEATYHVVLQASRELFRSVAKDVGQGDQRQKVKPECVAVAPAHGP
mmetsp:Transcript_50834/g.146687  ORF Transcript_50834/g.146687 Transcript_50834/m.146687 type:complete len:211 (-) Transcript_50834:261-893(-)